MQKFKSRKEWGECVWNKLAAGLAKTTSAEKVTQSLNMLLTAHEKKQMIKRAAAISLLKQRKSYREIGEILWLSSSTISAMRKSLQTPQGYTSRYMRNKKQEKGKAPTNKKDFYLEFNLWLENLFTLPPPPIPHPKLNSLLGIKNTYLYKKK